jgi:hypothetical protein
MTYYTELVGCTCDMHVFSKTIYDIKTIPVVYFYL